LLSIQLRSAHNQKYTVVVVVPTNECALSVGHPQGRYRQGSENVTCTSKELSNQLRSIDYQSETVYVSYLRKCGRFGSPKLRDGPRGELNESELLTHQCSLMSHTASNALRIVANEYRKVGTCLQSAQSV
jgi:hypothetical protein